MRTSLLACIFALLGLVTAKVTHGSIDSTDSMVFMDNFCMASDEKKTGTLTINIKNDKTKNNKASINTWYDDWSCENGTLENRKGCARWAWQGVWGNDSVSCSKARQVSVSSTHLNGTTESERVPMTDRVRPHYWYAAVTNCKEKTVKFDYTLKWIQPSGSQYSYDQRLLPLWYTLFACVWLAGIGANLYGDFLLLKEKSLHPVVRILTISIMLSFFGLLFYSIHWLDYGGNGIGVPLFNALGDICLYLTDVVFMFLLILLAKGWAITNVGLSDKKILLGVLGGFTALYFALFFWQYFGMNPATQYTVYESVPGGILLFLRLVVFGYFCWELFLTLKAETDSSKKLFYYIFGGLYSAWFISLPVIAGISMALSPWLRQNIVVFVQIFVLGVAQFGLAFLLWPSRASKYFTITAPDLLGYKAPSGGDYGAL